MNWQKCPGCSSQVVDLLRHYREEYHSHESLPVSTERPTLAGTAKSRQRPSGPQPMEPSHCESINRRDLEGRPPSRPTADPGQQSHRAARSCRCGGSNENCAFCFGTGTVETGPSMATVPSYHIDTVAQIGRAHV